MHHGCNLAIKIQLKIYKQSILLILSMQVLRVRRMGRERVLAIPKMLTKKLAAEYMAVSMDNAGRLIYTPIQGGA